MHLLRQMTGNDEGESPWVEAKQGIFCIFTQ